MGVSCKKAAFEDKNTVKESPEAMKAYLETHPFDPGNDDCVTVLDQIYLAYANAHESDPPEIRKGFEELEELLHTLPLRDNNAVCRLCGAYERKAFLDGLQYGAYLMQELT